MPVPLAIVLALLAQSVWGYSDDIYQSPESYDPYSDEYPDDTADVELHRRNSNNYLRFGRSGYAKRRDADYDDYPEDFARPTRSGNSGDKNDHFIRFGRSKQDFLRFGRVPRDKSSNYLRFGRSTEEKKREKRDAYTEFKRGGSDFMRFGRNSNFLRFGRNEGVAATAAAPDLHNQEVVMGQIKHFYLSPLVQLLAELGDNIKKEQSKCVTSA